MPILKIQKECIPPPKISPLFSSKSINIQASVSASTKGVLWFVTCHKQGCWHLGGGGTVFFYASGFINKPHSPCPSVPFVQAMRRGVLKTFTCHKEGPRARVFAVEGRVCIFGPIELWSRRRGAASLLPRARLLLRQPGRCYGWVSIFFCEPKHLPNIDDDIFCILLLPFFVHSFCYRNLHRLFRKASFGKFLHEFWSISNLNMFLARRLGIEAERVEVLMGCHHRMATQGPWRDQKPPFLVHFNWWFFIQFHSGHLWSAHAHQKIPPQMVSITGCLQRIFCTAICLFRFDYFSGSKSSFFASKVFLFNVGFEFSIFQFLIAFLYSPLDF